MARYFQHIDPSNEETFKKVTTLAYIDDSDPEMEFYVFSDGTRCNKLMVAVLNTPNPFKQYAMVEVENPTNIYKFIKRDIDYGEPIIKTTNRDGAPVEIPNPNYYDAAGNYHEPVTMDVTPPRRCNKRLESIDDYYLSRIIDDIDNNAFDESPVKAEYLPQYLQDKLKPGKADVKPAQSIVTEIDNSVEDPEPENVSESFDFNTTDVKEAELSTDLESKLVISDASVLGYTKFSPEEFVLTAEVPTIACNDEAYYNRCINMRLDDNWCITFDLDKTNVPKEIRISAEGHKEQSFTPQEFLKKLTLPEPKYGSLSVPDMDNASKELINGMIRMSSKCDSDIDMCLSLEIPPVDLFNVIHKVYKPEHEKLFVNTIANQIPETALREAIAEGLLNFYGGEHIQNLEDNKPE